MFKINYRIVETMEERLKMDKTTYDREWGDIEGLIELNFNGSRINYMYEGEITSDMLEAGCFRDELLISWFKNLLETVVILYQVDYVVLHEIEASLAIELQKDKLLLHVRELKDPTWGTKCGEKIIGQGWPSIGVEKFTTLVYGADEGKIEELEWVSTNFEKTTVLWKAFEQEVIMSAKAFLTEAETLFPNLVRSQTFATLREVIRQTEQCIQMNQIV